MKRYIYLSLIASMLLLIAFPPHIHAEDGRPPFEYLHKEEQEYVTKMMGAIEQARNDLKTARADLGTIFLQGYDDWYTHFPGEVSAMNGSIVKIKNIAAPGSFSGVASQA